MPYAKRSDALASQRRYKQRIKREVLNHYGDGCNCCGEINLAFLSIDHVNGDGAKHRREIGMPRGSGGGSQFYQWLRRNNYPEGFQVLCLNCNRAKHDYGICPHKQAMMAPYLEESKWVQETLF